MEKLLPVERIFEELEQRGFHEPENQGFVVKINLHQAEKSFNCQEYLKSGKKIGFDQPNNPFPQARMKYLFQKCISKVQKIDKIMA